MAITVSIASTDGVESNTIAGQDGTNIIMTISNLSGSSVNVTSASVQFTNPFISGLIGAMVLPQGGISIPANSSATMPTVSVSILLPQAQGQTSTASGGVAVVGAAQVSDGSTGVSSYLVIGVTPDLQSIPANDTTGLIRALAGTEPIYTNVVGPGMLRYDQPVLNSELYLFPSIFSCP